MSVNPSANVTKDLGAGLWFVERGIDEIVGVVVQLPDQSFVVHMDNGAPRFADSSEALSYARQESDGG